MLRSDKRQRRSTVYKFKKMNILITGANGFLAKELIAYFSQNPQNNLIPASYKMLDVTNAQQVSDFFDAKNIDIVVHTAIKGGKRGTKDSIDDFFYNITMFNNLLNCSHKYSTMFNFGSGAAFDRNSNIEFAKESDVHNCYPQDYYGLSKNLISRKITDLNSKVFNLRLFGCFGTFEEEQRFMRAAFKKTANGQPIIIHQNKYMDYFYAQDVGRVIEHIVNNQDKNMPRDINLCYQQKHKLTDIANKIIYLTESKKPVIIQESHLANSYTGCGKRLSRMNIELVGLDKGIEGYIEK